MNKQESFMTAWDCHEKAPTLEELDSYKLEYELENRNDSKHFFIRLTGEQEDLKCFIIAHQIDEDDNNYWD